MRIEELVERIKGLLNMKDSAEEDVNFHIRTVNKKMGRVVKDSIPKYCEECGRHLEYFLITKYDINDGSPVYTIGIRHSGCTASYFYTKYKLAPDELIDTDTELIEVTY